MVRNHATPRMEVMYEENYPRYNCVDNVNNLKRSNLSLDLNSCGPQAKRTKFMNVANTPLLSSPDYKKLNINTPEIERMLLAQNGLSTPTPGLGMYPTKPVSLEVENFTRGFEEALHELQHSDSSQGGHPQVELPRSSSSSNSSATYVTLDSQYGPFAVKEEPQTVPMGHSPPVSPIDMEHQERYKLERKRERNRVAASKCRRRKLERIARLEDKVKLLKGENTELSTVVAKLKEQVCLLKEQVMEHVNSGCEILPPLNQQQLITGL